MIPESQPDSGSRIGKAACRRPHRRTLKEMGYAKVRNLGGFKGWLDAGGEVEKA